MKLPNINRVKMVRNYMYVGSEGVKGYKTYTEADVLKTVRLVKSGSLSLDSIRNKP